MIRSLSVRQIQRGVMVKRLLQTALWALLITACIAPHQGKAASGTEMQSVLEAAKKDLARRLGVKEESIQLLDAIEEVTWPDSSLGCPEPGKLYAQILTPGYRLKLQSGGKVYEYHATKNLVKLCNR